MKGDKNIDILYQLNDAIGGVYSIHCGGTDDDTFDERLNDATHAAYDDLFATPEET